MNESTDLQETAFWSNSIWCEIVANIPLHGNLALHLTGTSCSYLYTHSKKALNALHITPGNWSRFSVSNTYIFTHFLPFPSSSHMQIWFICSLVSTLSNSPFFFLLHASLSLSSSHSITISISLSLSLYFYFSLLFSLSLPLSLALSFYFCLLPHLLFLSLTLSILSHGIFELSF